MLYDHLIPLIYPIFPDSCGTLWVNFDAANALKSIAETTEDCSIHCVLDVISENSVVSSQTETFLVKSGQIVGNGFIEKSYSLPGPGYLQLKIVSDKPIFKKNQDEVGYALLVRQDWGLVTINPQHKTSVHIIIDQIRETQKFCLVHQQQGVDQAVGINNSTFLVNPYEGPLIASAKVKDGKAVKIRVPSRSARLLHLGDIFGQSGSGCVIYTGSNRFIGWDVRYQGVEFANVNSVDHLEYFRANATFGKFKGRDWVTQKVKHTLNQMGIPTT